MAKSKAISVTGNQPPGAPAHPSFNNSNSNSNIQEILTGLRHTAAISFRERLADRIEILLAAYKNDSDGEEFSAASLRSFIHFLVSANNLKYPAVTLTPGGDLYASWKEDRVKVFSVQFLATKQVRFVVFRPSPANTGQIDQISGITTPDALMDVLAPLNVLDWAAA